MPERTITVTQAVEGALMTLARRVEHEAGCATEADFSATCTCGLSDALNVIEAALATPQQEQARCGGSGVLKAPGGSFDSSAAPCPGCIDCEPDHPVVPEQVEEDGWPAELVIATRPDGFAVNESGPIYPTRRYVLAPTEPSYGGEG